MLPYRELFALGSNFNTYLNQGTEEEIKAVTDISAQLYEVLTQKTLARLNKVEKEIHLLVAGDVWCSDCQLNITALNHMSLIQAKIKYSIISKECAEQHMLLSLELQQIKIPLMYLLDSNVTLTELFVERPITVSSVKDFEHIKEAYSAGKYLNDTVNEILDRAGV